MIPVRSFLKKALLYLDVQALQKLDKKLWRFTPEKEHFLFRTLHTELLAKLYGKYEPIPADKKTVYDLFLEESFTSYICKSTQPALLEPKYGWIITAPFKVSEYSFMNAVDPWDLAKRKPSTLDYLLPKKTIKLDAAISLRFGWNNYYHFLFDTLGQIALANQHLDKNIPIIAPSYLTSFGYVEEVLSATGLLQGRKLILQKPGEYYLAGTMYTIKDTAYSNTALTTVKAFEKLLPKTDHPDRTIFLGRKPKSGRSISNWAEIKHILDEFNIDIVDTGSMTVQQQAELFAGVRHLVAVHGAGLANIIFRNGQPLNLLELFPAHLTAEFYRNISTLFGYTYDMMQGTHLDNNYQFYIDPQLFREKLEAFLPVGFKSK